LGISTEVSLLDDVTMLTSAMVNNAVVHSGRRQRDEILVSASVSEGVLRVEVSDHEDGLETLEPRSLKPPSGLSFHVWFEIDVVSRESLYCAPA